MRIALALALAALLLAACNLSDDVPSGPTAQPTGDQPPGLATDANLPTPLPGVLPPQTPGVLPTRTPFGNALPTSAPLIGAPVGAGTLAPTPGAVATSPTGETAAITSPANGANVTVGVLQVSGVVVGLARDEFDLILTDASGSVINSQHITLQNPNAVAEVPWSASMTTGAYTGPAQVEVVGINALDQEIPLARISITLTTSAASAPGSLPVSSGVGVGGRSSTPVASFSSPSANAVVSGGSIQVNGVAGGIPDNQFVVVLVAPDSRVLNSQLVTLTNDDYTTVVPWSLSLGTSGYTGSAEIRAFATVSGAQTTLTSIPVTIR